MKSALLLAIVVGSGGFCGTLLRFAVSGLMHRQGSGDGFPYGTLAVNLLGCFGIGVLMGWVEGRQLLTPELRRFLLIGLLGGFTTFSTFGYETFAMLRDAEYVHALANVCLHVILGLTLVWLGYTLTTAR
jgi:CrcB protein